MTKTILVTGGCGFIGKHFLRLAFSRGYRVLNLDKLSYCSSEPDPLFPFYHLNIGDETAVLQLLENKDVSYVVNFAAESSVDKSNDAPQEFVENNIAATTRLLSACRRYGKLIKFVHISTDEVYGHLSLSAPSFTEETAYNPRNPYAASKAASDFIALSFFHTFGVPVVVTHCTNNYGPDQFPEKLIPKTITRCRNREPIPIYGNGLNVRDWIFVSDHCDAVLKVMENGILGETYNIAGNNELNNLEVVGTICDRLSPILGYNCRDLITFVADRPGHDFRYSIDASKIKNELGFLPRHNWNEGLNETIRRTLNAD